MDLRLKGMGGVEAVRRIRHEFPAGRVLVLTTYDGDEDIHQALRAGARGYVLKGSPSEELLRAIRAVYAGGLSISPEAAGRLAERMLGTELTAREVDVLRLVVRGRSNKEIGAALALTEATVKGYLHQIFGKMGVADRTEAATQAIKRGIVRLD